MLDLGSTFNSMNNRKCFFLFFLCCLCNRTTSQELLGQYVDTRVGTAASVTQTAGKFGKHSEEYGQTLPAVLVPHGMNFWTPQTQDTEQKCIAPYYYRDSKLQGFRNSHWIVGGCTQDYGSMTLMTISGELKTTPAERASTFFHEKETATPSYYSAYLEDYHAQAEMTAQSHSALFRFTYDEAGMAYLIVNPNSDQGEGYIEIDLEKREIRGYNPAHRIYQGWGRPTGFSGYFVLRFEKEPSTYGVYQDSLVYSKQKSIGKKCNIGAFIGFKVAAHEKVMVKAGSSFTDMKGALNNLDAEIPHWNFDQCRKQLEQCWEQQLSKIRVEGGSREEKEKFYGALYRSSFLPRVFNDVDGRYPSFAKGTPICQVENGDYYDDFSMWDTYRALHPLLTIIDPEREGKMVRSLIEKYKQGGWLPIFPCWNSYTAAMIGDHAISVIGDAYIKGIKGFDIKAAYEAMRKNAFQSPASSEDYKNGMGRRALASYLKYGYIPLEDSVLEAFHTNEQVSRTLEYAYDDYVLAQVAKQLGEISDYKLLAKRAKNWQNVIDQRTGYAQGRHADGTFLDADNAFGFARFITEGAPCHYTWYVPQDVQGLVEWMGGKNKFVSKLDSMFSELRYWHGNEPCHQIAYLYNYVGMPWKTQKQVRHIRNTEYVNAPGGLSGNDDAGQMSAWYVFSAIGFYPVCPGNPYYVIGSPAFEKTTIRLESGKKFVVKAHGVSSGNIYIQSATLNGKRFENSYIAHKQVLEGGILEFVMGAVPNKSWAVKKENWPQSILE
jgi:predicted alpha-1,2-mannosidase